ncbi:pro-FMRFamide-related neuropeptide FF [Lathamus discolor]|uniref:pro-FMRFamide-related neuropeptide FF n=1 Tax=Lathamus discolor TaxID=678569 RepID=UPI0032B862DE
MGSIRGGGAGIDLTPGLFPRDPPLRPGYKKRRQRQRAVGAMDGRMLLLLLLLLLGGALCTPRSCPVDPGLAPAAAVSPGPPLPSAFLGAMLRSLQRPGRSPGPPVQPQRVRGQPQLSPRSWDPPAAPFWTMATPQRFGRRR